MKKTVLGLTLVGGIASASVYVVPPDIDAYKQKTDQAYTDLYKNEQSPIANGITSNDLNRLNAIGTPNAVLQRGADIRKALSATVQGTTVAEGTHLRLSLAGNYIDLIAQNGSWKVASCDGSWKCTTLGTWVKMEREYGHHCVSSSKYGCTKEGKNAQQVFVNGATGELKNVDQYLERTRSCSKYGCNSWSEWKIVKTNRYQEGAINLQKAIRDGVVQLDVPINTSLYPIDTEEDVLGKHG
jgi:hypothetical protein